MTQINLAELSPQQCYERNLQRYRQGKKLDQYFLSQPLVSPDEPLASSYLRAVSQPNPVEALRRFLEHVRSLEQTQETKDYVLLANRALYTIFIYQNEYRTAVQQLRCLEEMGENVGEQLHKLLQMMGYVGGLPEELYKPENKNTRDIYQGDGQRLARFDQIAQFDRVDYFK